MGKNSFTRIIILAVTGLNNKIVSFYHDRPSCRCNGNYEEEPYCFLSYIDFLGIEDILG